MRNCAVKLLRRLGMYKLRANVSIDAAQDLGVAFAREDIRRRTP